jgi:hypothetical protein
MSGVVSADGMAARMRRDAGYRKHPHPGTLPEGVGEKERSFMAKELVVVKTQVPR